MVLTHPLEDLQPALGLQSTDGGPEAQVFRWRGEAVLWSSAELPFVASYNEVRHPLFLSSFKSTDCSVSVRSVWFIQSYFAIPSNAFPE